MFLCSPASLFISCPVSLLSYTSTLMLFLDRPYPTLLLQYQVSLRQRQLTSKLPVDQSLSTTRILPATAPIHPMITHHALPINIIFPHSPTSHTTIKPHSMLSSFTLQILLPLQAMLTPRTLQPFHHQPSLNLIIPEPSQPAVIVFHITPTQLTLPTKP